MEEKNKSAKNDIPKISGKNESEIIKIIKNIGRKELQKEFPIRISFFRKEQKTYNDSQLIKKARILAPIIEQRCSYAFFFIIRELRSHNGGTLAYNGKITPDNFMTIFSELIFYIISQITFLPFLIFKDRLTESAKKTFITTLLLDIYNIIRDKYFVCDDVVNKNSRKKFISIFISDYFYRADKLYNAPTYAFAPEAALIRDGYQVMAPGEDFADWRFMLLYCSPPLKFFWSIDYIIREDRLMHPGGKHPLTKIIENLTKAIMSDMILWKILWNIAGL